MRLTSKILDEFEHVRVLPEALRPKLSAAAAASGALYSGCTFTLMQSRFLSLSSAAAASSSDATDASISSVLERLPVNQQYPFASFSRFCIIAPVWLTSKGSRSTSTSMALVPSGASSSSALMAYGGSASSQVVARLGHQHNVPKPKWHAPWKLMRVRRKTSLFVFMSSRVTKKRSSLGTLAGFVASPWIRRTSGLPRVLPTARSRSGILPAGRSSSPSPGTSAPFVASPSGTRLTRTFFFALLTAPLS